MRLLILEQEGKENVLWNFPGGAVDKNPPASAGDARDVGSLPGSGRSLKWEMATHSSILAWRIPWIEEPGELQSIGLVAKSRTGMEAAL